MTLPHYPGNNINMKGYSHEKFKSGKLTVYKYSTEPSRKKFVQNQYDWLKLCKDTFPFYGFVHLEIIMNGDETGISMDKIIAIDMSDTNAKDLVTIVKKLKTVPTNTMVNGPALDSSVFPTVSSDYNFNNYINYVKDIVLKNPDIFAELDWYKYEDELKKYIEFANESISFHHGDFTVDNVLWDGCKYTLIDPNYKNTIYGSYLLDLSKLFQETRYSNESFFEAIKNEIVNQFKFDDFKMRLLYLIELTHYVRMIPYVIKYNEVYTIKHYRMNQLITLLNLNT